MTAKSQSDRAAREIPVALEPGIARIALDSKPAAPVTAAEREALRAEIKELLVEQDAVLVVHYYVDEDLQILADETGGRVSDSLDMAAFGAEHPAQTLLVCGVRFMGETAKILNPEKRVLMPELYAECSLDLGCPPQEFAAFCDAHPDRTVVVYANTSAEVKARADWVVTSSNALEIASHLKERGEKILWAPDKHLGAYIRDETGADMLLWEGICVVHDEFRADALADLKAEHPEAALLAHPESPQAVVAMADRVGSTTKLIQAAAELPNEILIVATDRGIFHKMAEAAPGKTLLEAPTGGHSATCISCAHCPWMAMNGLISARDALRQPEGHEIAVDPAIRVKAVESIQRMLDFSHQQGIVTRGASDA